MKKILLSIIALLSISATTFSQNWNEMIKAVASDREAGDLFGYSVSISGNKAIVGAYKKDTSKGAAYIFELNGGVWIETAKLEASDGSTDDNFGIWVSISGDKAIVGAYLEDHDISGGAMLSGAGSAYIFELSGGIWSEKAKLVASDRSSGDNFGRNVSISGNKVIVGAWKEDHDVSGGDMKANAGSAYIFELSGGVWTETAKLVASDRSTDDNFGLGICISGNKVIIGARLEDHDTSGGAAISSAGSAYIFELSGGVWTETAKLVASDRAGGDYFGLSVSIDGNRAIVGSYLDNHNGSVGTPQGDVGSAYIFELSGGVWNETAKLIASDGISADYFGVSVSLSGNKVIIGAYQEDHDASGGALAYGAGSAYIFEFSGGVWSEVEKIVPSDRAAGDYFGVGVGISGDRVIVGAFKEDQDTGTINDDAGSAYMFNYCSANPTVTVSGATLSSISAGALYQWIDCGNGNAIIPSDTNQSFTATVNGNYAVIVTDGNCYDTSACISITNVGIKKSELTNESFVLYPNPTHSIVNLESAFKNKEKTITITDLSGKLVQSITTTEDKIDISELKSGIYFLNLKTDKGIATKRLIKN